MAEQESDEKRMEPGKECLQFRTGLPAYLEGEEKPEILLHKAQCTPCESLLSDLELIRTTAKDWPLETPPPGVWSNIRATLKAEGVFRPTEDFWWKQWIPRRNLGWTLAAAAGAAASLVILVVVFFSTKNLQRNTMPGGSSTAVAMVSGPADLTPVQDNLVHTVQQMEESYKARATLLDPSVKRSYEEGLSSLDSSIRECLTSLHEEPRNDLAREYLMQAYAAKAQVLASALEYDSR